MQCPKCKKLRTSVVDSRPCAELIRRRRRCACGHRFSTIEISAALDVRAISAALAKVASAIDEGAAKSRRRLMAVESELATVADALPKPFEAPAFASDGEL